MVHFDVRALQCVTKLSLFHSHMASPSSAMSPPKVALPPNSTISLLGFAARTLIAAPTPEFTRTSAAMNTMRKIKEGFIVKKASSLPLRNTKKRKEADQRTRIELSQNLLTRARETYASARNLRDAFYFNAFARGYLCSLLPRPAEATLSARSRSQRFRTEFVEARSISYLARLVEDATRKQFRETPGVPFQKNARETARAHFLNGTTGFTPNSSARARNFVAILLFP